MESRERILGRTKQNQPPKIVDALNYSITPAHSWDTLEKFKSTLNTIGGIVQEINRIEEIKQYIVNTYSDTENVFVSIPGSAKASIKKKGHDYKDVKAAVLMGDFGIAECGAIWITEKSMLDRSLPFICENLILLLNRRDIVPTMHEAYIRIDTFSYQFGTFIAGPSKTADIEQSLVLGAHGPKTLTVFILND